MRAVLHDASGPRWTRALVPGLGVLVAALGALWSRVDGRPLGPDFFLGAALALVGPMLLGRHRPRAVELTALPGRVQVRRAGLLRQTIRGRSMRGASTSRSATGITLALDRAERAEPTLLVVRDEAELKALRDALGIGHRGFGALSGKTRASDVDRLWTWSRAVIALGALYVGGAGILGTEGHLVDTVRALTLGCIIPVVILISIYVAANAGRKNLVRLSSEGVSTYDAIGEKTVPFVEIEEASASDGKLKIRRKRGLGMWTKVSTVHHSRHGMTPYEIAHVLAQIDDASRRARGEFGPEASVAAAEPLARREEETARAWIERLDATAEQLNVGASYRGAPVTEADLWSALEDHDAPPALRAAAARVLSRTASPAARARIDGILAAVRDGHARARMRVAIEPDVERAARELGELDEFDELGQAAAARPRT